MVACMLMQQQCDCLYYGVDKDMLGGEGWQWGRGDGSAAWHYDYYYIITHRTAECPKEDRTGTGLDRLILMRMVHGTTSALCLSTRSRCLTER